uniref:Uncharacterized protein n=1 Tax=Rhizophagus irregularis (strain DAOM 181602 / DAOM 197198 / MUCL 43194) TaxID=747089 RepID=U9TMR4_RHIID
MLLKKLYKSTISEDRESASTASYLVAENEILLNEIHEIQQLEKKEPIVELFAHYDSHIANIDIV